MEYTIKAIPTRYAGVEFRSRLEARWAAFFDLAGWQWEYEPFDLEGWAPDFRLVLPDESEFLVEVKPAKTPDAQAFEKALRHTTGARHRDPDDQIEYVDPMYEFVVRGELVLKSAIDWEVLCLGASPFLVDRREWYDPFEKRQVMVAGPKCDYFDDGLLTGFNNDASYKLLFDGTGAVALCVVDICVGTAGSVDGMYFKDALKSAASATTQKAIRSLWNEAGNRVQWKPRA